MSRLRLDRLQGYAGAEDDDFSTQVYSNEFVETGDFEAEMEEGETGLKQPSVTSKTELPAQGGPVSTETATVSGEDSNWAAEMEELRTKVKEQKMLLEEENKKPKGASRRMSRETHKLRKEVNHNKESILNNIAKVIDDRRISTPSCCPTASTPETLRSVS